MKKLVALLVFVAVVIGAAWIAFAADYSDGYRVGQVIKLSRSGTLSGPIHPQSHSSHPR